MPKCPSCRSKVAWSAGGKNAWAHRPSAFPCPGCAAKLRWRQVPAVVHIIPELLFVPMALIRWLKRDGWLEVVEGLPEARVE